MSAIRLFILLVVTVLFVSCENKKDENKSKEKKPIAVEFMTSSAKELQKSFKGSGLTIPVRKTTVQVKAAGDVVSFGLKIGQKVKAKQSVIKILSRRQKAAYDQSKVQVEEAKLAYDAVTKLFDKGSVSKAEFLRTKNSYSSAMMQLMANKIAYNDCFVTFPFSGTVNWYEETIHKGSIVQPGTSICEIIDLSKIKVKLFFSENRVVKMSIGDSAAVTIPVLKQEFPGTVTAIAPAASDRTGSFAVEVTFDNSKDMQVKAGMRSEVAIYTGESDKGYLVPKRFVREHRGTKGLYIAVERGSLMDKSDTTKSEEDPSDIIAHFRPLSFYSNGSDSVFITEGLSSEDKIITSAFSRLRDNCTVTPIEIGGEE